jgi:hypothetical protein
MNTCNTLAIKGNDEHLLLSPSFLAPLPRSCSDEIILDANHWTEEFVASTMASKSVPLKVDSAVEDSCCFPGCEVALFLILIKS